MNITRALSVREGNLFVSWAASQSSEGTVSRGKRVACWSASEKSRHLRQDEAEETLCGGPDVEGELILGLVASNLDKSGRVDDGIGGGTALCPIPLAAPSISSSSCLKGSLGVVGGMFLGGSFLVGWLEVSVVAGL